MNATAALGSAATIPLTVSWFPTALPTGPALGDPERTTWGEFASVFTWRREGQKDGPNFVPARFTLEPDGRHVRRLKRNLTARTAIALDVETNKKTGEIPPLLTEAAARITAAGWAAVLYSSHNHHPAAPRYRIILPLSEEIDHDLPAVEVVAELLGLRGVLDQSKVGAASLFYCPSRPQGGEDHHHTEIIPGTSINAAGMREAAGAILAERQAEADRVAAVAHAEAAARRDAKIAAGFDPDDSLIEKLRSRFDLDDVLRSHGYDKAGTKYRHPNSTSGSYGADIKIFGGIERVFSHNGTDPLHGGNLPSWCGGVTALDVIDVVTILDYGGNRPKALADLARRFGLTKAAERKAVAGLLFRLIRSRATQEEIEAAAFQEGERLGLSRAEVVRVAQWVASQPMQKEAA
ncbi:MAG TPA: hypothetical protein VND19_18740 [Acetobacteraceae bacterium]|nr:hypothetical protein [Acetobacteraceae bacterium]